MRWQVGKSGRVVRWQGGKCREEVRSQSGRLMFLFNSGGHRVSPRFHLFVSDVNQKTKEQDMLKTFLRGRRDGKILLRSDASC